MAGVAAVKIGEIMSDVGTWNVLLPALVGGAIGIVGSFVGPFFLQRLKDATLIDKVELSK
jgi:hypothetical protein